MSERILRALMQLFSIIADVEQSEQAKDGRRIVQSFLKGQLPQALVNEYLIVFDEYIEAGQKKNKNKEKKRKRTSLNSVKILKICTQINEELAQKQKLIVLIRILEYIHADGQPSEQENEFVSTVAETFNISKEEFEQCNKLAENNNLLLDHSDFLHINGNEIALHTLAKHIYAENLNGNIVILRLESVKMYVISYDGSDEIYLNGLILSAERVHVLTPGSSIRSSKVNAIYYSDIISQFLSDSSQKKITFEARSVEYKFPGGKIGVQNFNYKEESGKLIGIMGGSGAGKSTLLNVLNSIEKPSSGEVLINGLNIHTETDKAKSIIGYISQDDLLIEELTVFENLYFNAKLCFAKLSNKEIKYLCIDLLKSIGLYETRHLKVGSPLQKTISGGQRKRLNIALELIREPSVLFVDEPTSGLSSRDSENIMDLLKELALKGKLIFVVIHQPSSEIFKMFDKLIILDVGGYPIYLGNPVDGIVYFKKIVRHVNSDESECIQCGNVNPEQIFNIIESKVVDEYGESTDNRKISPIEFNQFYQEQIEQKQSNEPIVSEFPESTFNIPNKIKQFIIFSRRDILSKLTNKQYMLINLLEAPVLAFILAYLIKYYNTDISNTVGYVFRDNSNLPAYLFMSVIVALFLGLTVSAEEIIRDRKILKRETFLNLSRSSYLYSKISIMFFLSAIQSISFVLIGNTILEIQGMNLDYWFILFSTSCFANMLGLNISSAFNSAVTIYIVIPFLLIPQLLLSGVIVKFDKLNPTISSHSVVPVTGEIMASRWAFEALAVNQVKHNEFSKDYYVDNKRISISDYKTNYWLPKLMSKMARVAAAISDTSKSHTLEQNLFLIRTEIQKDLLIKKKGIDFTITDSLTAEHINHDVLEKTIVYLQTLKNFYKQMFKMADKRKDGKIGDHNKTKEDREIFLAKKNAYSNESLENLVKNSNELNKVIEAEGALIQKTDPIYHDPYGRSIRAHFFAPRKKIGDEFYDTYWVNAIVIWIMSLILIFTLYFDLFKKLLDGLEKILSNPFSNK
ncbi:MAG: ATP-binding cassette domain-containing protein [Flavobacteriales bacterium]|nr:ATP-binding cassette domain-containing protein [Flavobacteriales bacterium]